MTLTFNKKETEDSMVEKEAGETGGSECVE